MRLIAEDGQREWLKLADYATRLTRDDWQKVVWSGEAGGQKVYAHLVKSWIRKLGPTLVLINGKRGWRKVFLGKASVQAIQSYMRERGPGRYDALWLNAQGKPLTMDSIRQIVDRLAAEASVTGRHNLHAFRHAVAQAWLDNGINAEIVSKALGHADVMTTLMIYGNQDDRRVSQAVREAEMAPFYDP